LNGEGSGEMEKRNGRAIGGWIETGWEVKDRAVNMGIIGC